jgi:hypothetical protein
MGSEKIHTDFAPAERASENEIRYQRTLFEGDLLTKQMLKAVPSMLLVLNPERQIVYANDSVFETLGVTEGEWENVFGKRPGEVSKCIHAFETKGGCGTTVFCSACGAAKAILASHKNKSEIQECRIIQDKTGDALDLRVRANPLKMADAFFQCLPSWILATKNGANFLNAYFFTIY